MTSFSFLPKKDPESNLLELIHSRIDVQSTLSKTDTFGIGTECPSYRESNKRSKERHGPTLRVPFTEVSVKRELTVLPC